MAVKTMPPEVLKRIAKIVDRQSIEEFKAWDFANTCPICGVGWISHAGKCSYCGTMKEKTK